MAMKTTINDYGYNCEGVGRVNGKVCFLPFALKGEEVEFDIEKETSSFINGKLKKVMRTSEKRIAAPCKYFGKCGGCALQNVELEEENKIKKEIAAGHFKKIGFKGEIGLVSVNDYFYRNKIKLFCNKNGLGLKKNDSAQIVNIDKCLIASERINEVISFCQDFIKAKQLEDKLENLIIRSEGENVLVHFAFKEKVDVDFQGLQIMLGAGSGIYYSFYGFAPMHALGAEELSETIGGVKISYNVSSFKQVNDAVMKKLYEDALSKVKGRNVINAYSGAGLLTALVAKKGIICSGIELGESEHEDAQRLKSDNGLSKMQNYHGDCKDILPKVITKDTSTIILDPSRKGCESEIMKRINESQVERVIYISCEVPTQTRDLKLLSNYKIQSVCLYNMFPRTAKVECLVVLDKKSAKSLQQNER